MYAFFVPNRIVNDSWKAVEGENYSGSWTSNPVSLAPLKNVATGSTSIPVGSVADYYGFPTQEPIPNSVLSLCHDLKFRGYVMIYNEFFRDQNYQAPIPMSYLNVYQGFLDPASSPIFLDGKGNVPLGSDVLSDGSYGAGAISHALYGSSLPDDTDTFVSPRDPINSFRATQSPLKANKLHDYFTSVLPSPQKSSSPVFAPVTGSLNIPAQPVSTVGNFELSGVHVPLLFRSASGAVPSATQLGLGKSTSSSGITLYPNGLRPTTGTAPSDGAVQGLYPSNLSTTATTADVTGLALSVDDIRMASAIQQVYETLARGGSRYRSIVSSFFGIDVDDPFGDIPRLLGHISRDLDLYQTAQTSASEAGSTPQGNLTAFGYTSSNGHLCTHRFVEHGYLHVFAVVRHRNIYSSYLARDNFRLNMLDFYTPPLANISEQPVYTREINPFAPNNNSVFGYQEAWAEYRYEPDQVSGYMRPGIDNSLRLWTYADEFDPNLLIADSAFLLSNSQDVLDKTLAVTSSVAPQFKASFKFIVDKTLPMPVYSVPGMDII